MTFEKIATFAIGMVGSAAFALVVGSFWIPTPRTTAIIALAALVIACAARLKAMGWSK